ncbi:peptidoglycan DD-metalloendopeptidase family protein [Pelagibacteraceae bacterium]|mgnify:FL=1|jgi:murein DD-endopeptidase MepM/ murein hydrolase activator NlpD|nr:peptidoglycan DD-metalloendopeptidase family protein [Pelagibacteraceae bacterium]|tara:strand:+ start:31 stop:1371 length:1341 start_codon:yes stop_codon:yes gene_type:complete
MPLNQIFNQFPKIFKHFKNTGRFYKLLSWKYFIYLFSILLFYSVFIIISNLIDQKKKIEDQNLNTVVKTEEFSKLSNYFISKINSPYKEVQYSIQKNDSIEKILKKYAIRANDIKIISNNLKQKNLINIYAGRKLSLVLKKLDDGSNTVVNLIYPINNTLSIEIRKNQNNFIIKENILQLYKKEVVIKNVIKNNLYSAAIDAGIEPNIIVEFARIFGFEVDFQRDIRKGDWFEILYERFEDDNNIVRDTGKIIYASMFVNGSEINLYSFKDKNDFGFYDLKGKSIVKSLMKTPINGARLSSSFGNRKHPILGYTKLHTGTDFAAPSGTPIMASGAGKIIRARWCGGGGNCVKIKHNSIYETVYAHMKNFARGIKEGKRVSQGQIIGYVGSTGMSTGPHLHYEVIINGRKVNSQKLKLPSGKILKGYDRENFELERIKIDIKLSELR